MARKNISALINDHKQSWPEWWGER